MSKNGLDFSSFMISKEQLPYPCTLFSAIKLRLFAVNEEWKNIILAARELRNLLTQNEFNPKNAHSAIEYIYKNEDLYELACSAGILNSENGTIGIADIQRILGKNGLIDLEKLRKVVRCEVERIFIIYKAELTSLGFRSDKQAASMHADDFWFKPLSDSLLENARSMHREGDDHVVKFKFEDSEQEIFPEDLATDHPLSKQVLELFVSDVPFNENNGPDPAILLETEEGTVHYHPRPIYLDEES